MTSLPSIRINQRGKTSQRWQQWRNRQALLVAQRAQGKCECEDPECHDEPVDRHHVFGRRHIIAEPLASHHTMSVALSREHHNRIHHNPDSRWARMVQRAALNRAAWWFHLARIENAPALEAQLRADGSWEQLCADAGRG